MTRVFYASTLFGALTLAAAVDAGTFGERRERRLLITSNNSAVPEIVDRFDRSPVFDVLRPRFDDVVHWNDIIAPLHPSGWVPPAAEVPMLSRLITDRLGLVAGEQVSELVVESVAVAPARTLGMLIPDCPVSVYSDGLMSYGPTRDDVAVEIGARLQRLLYLELLPGLTPLLLREHGIPAVAIPDSAFAKVLAELPAPTGPDVGGAPMIVGQYLSDLGVVSPAEEIALYGDLLRGLAARGHTHAVFAPHPMAGPGHSRAMKQSAAELGVHLDVVAGGLPVEAWFAAYRPSLVTACFSTALLTARALFDLPVACAGTELVLERIAPYQNSNRVPATLVDATVARLRPDGTLVEPGAVDVERLLPAVGYCMQAARHPDLRGAAEEYVRAHGPRRYFKRRRLEQLALLAPPARRSAPVRRVAAPVWHSLSAARSAAGIAANTRRPGRPSAR